jgi:hypothetical protein
MRQADGGGGRVKRLIAALAASASLLFAEVNGTVLNQSTGKPQPNATVTLYKLGGAGMDSVESVKSGADGKFVINQPVEGPHLVQTAFDGVTYNHMLPPGRPTTGLSLTVYNASVKRPPGARVDTHMVLLEPGAGQLSVNESVIFKNDGTLAYNDPAGGTLRIFVPENATGRIGVRATAPQGMAVERAAVKTGTPGVYKIDFPVKPGETRFDISYAVPLDAAGTFSGKVLHGGGPVRVVSPAGVTLKSDSLRLLGQEPTTQASVFELKSPEYSVRIEGTGSLQSPAGGADEEESGAGLQQIWPAVYDRFLVILGLALLIFLFGFIILYRRGALGTAPAVSETAATAAAAKSAGKGKRRG